MNRGFVRGSRDAPALRRAAAYIAPIMPNDPAAYAPIRCDFHDLLEARATARRSARIRFRDDVGIEQTRDATIVDVYARGGAEYMTLSSGETVRLDRIIQVDDARLTDF